MERFDSASLDPSKYHFLYEDDVRYRDLDILGHVNNGAMAQYFSDARVKLFYEFMPEWPNVPAVLVVANQRFEYFAELYYPNRIKVGLRLIRFGESSCTMGGILFCDDKLIAANEILSVLIDRKTRRPVPISEELKKPILDILR